MFGKITSLLKDESGATAIEYSLIAALVSVAAIAMVSALATMFTTVAQNLSDAVNQSS
jgi:pilus assembly protein Flp/PilA